MRLKHHIYLLFTLMLPIFVYGDHCGGKVDIGPVFVHLDVLESGKTIKTLDMGGVKLNGTIMIKEGYGFCVKPDVLYATGNGELFAGALGLGHIFPLNSDFCITPVVGLNLSNLSTSVDLPNPYLQQKVNVKERFRSLAPYVALEANYNFCKGYRICGSFQYSWSRTHTWLKKIGTFKSHSKGASYAMMLEKDFSESWSMHLGAAYNSSLSHERHGLRGYGFKLGTAYWS